MQQSNMPRKGLILFLGTRDLEQTHRFYTEALGLSMIIDQGACRIYQVPGGGFIGFCAHIVPVYGEKSPIVTIVSPDVDGFFDRLVEWGAKIPHPPQINERFGIYHFFLYDPNGYTLEIQRFVNP